MDSPLISIFRKVVGLMLKFLGHSERKTRPTFLLVGGLNSNVFVSKLNITLIEELVRLIGR